MRINSSQSWIIPDWPAPATVRAIITTRALGNLALHVADDPLHVLANRQALIKQAHLPSEPLWLKQVHGTTVVHVRKRLSEHEPESQDESDAPPEGDAAVAVESGQVCAVLTADCLPILLCNRAGTCVGAVHAGWRGLATGVIESTVQALQEVPHNIVAYLGPAISAGHFEVGAEVFEAFKVDDRQKAFVATELGKWRADLYQLARLRLKQLGIIEVYGGEYCTYADAARFYSYRRSGVRGRVASLIWLEALDL